MIRDTPFTLKEIIDALTKIYEQHGDLDVELNTQDGAFYEIWSDDHIIVNTFDDGTKFVEIG